MEKLQEKIFEVLKKAQDAQDFNTNQQRQADLINYQNEIMNDIHVHYDPVKAVTNQIKNDDALFALWRDNIATSFKNLVKYNHMIGDKPITALDPDLVHNLANQAATNFLNLLCDIKPESNGDIPHIPGE